MPPEIDFTLFCVSVLVGSACIHHLQTERPPKPWSLVLLWLSASLVVESRLRLVAVFAGVVFLAGRLFWPVEIWPQAEALPVAPKVFKPPRRKRQKGLPPAIRPPWERV